MYLPTYLSLKLFAGILSVPGRFAGSLIFLAFLTSPVFSQPFVKAQTNFSIREYGKGNTDIPTNLTKSIIQDVDGRIWVASDNGLILFNGNTFTVITENLPSFLIKRFYQSPSYKYPLIITDLGVVAVESTVPFKTSMIVPGNNTVTDSTTFYAKSVFEDKARSFWLGEPGSVLHSVNGRLKRYQFDEKYRADDFFRAFQFNLAGDSTLLVTSQRGYFFYFNPQSDAFSPIEIIGNYQPTAIDAFVRLEDERFLVGTESGVYEAVFNNGYQSVSLNKIASVSRVSSIVSYKNYLVVGSWRTGCWLIDPTRNNAVVRLKDLSLRVISDLFVSEDNTIWISSDEGFAFLKEPLFATLELPTETLFIQHLEEQDDGSILATEGNHVFHVTLTESGPRFENLFRARSGLIMSLSGTPDTFFAGYKDGFLDKVVNGKVVRTYRYSEGGETGRLIQCIVRTPGDTLFFQSVGQPGFGMIFPDGSDTLITDPSAFSSTIGAVTWYSGVNRLYLGGNSSETVLSYFDFNSQTFTNVSQWKGETRMENLGVSTITNDGNGTIYLGTTRGLALSDGKSLWFAPEIEDNTNIHSLLVEEEGGVWIGHEQGIIYLKNGETVRFDTDNGMGNTTVSFRSMVKTPDGRLWVGTAAGISYFRVPGLPAINRSKPPSILSIRVNENIDSTVASAPLSVISGSALELTVSAFMFPSENVRYRMVVEGNEGMRRDWRTQTTFFIPNLHQGNYTIKIWAKQNGAYTSEPTILPLRVFPTWYQTWWAQTLAIIILIAAGISVSYWRKNVIQRRLAVKRLQESERQNRELMEALPDFWIKLSGSNRLIDFHHSTENLPFILVDKLVPNQALSEIFPDEVVIQVLNSLHRTIFSGEFEKVVFSWLADGNQLDYEVRSLVLGNGEYLVIFRDFSKEKQIEREIIHARETALEVSRLKTEFLATMSHEIRTPMNAVIGMTSLLRKTDLSPEQIEYVSTLYDSSETLMRIINEVLDFSKIESGNLAIDIRPFNIISSTEAVLNIFKARAVDKGLFMQIIYDPWTRTEVIGDETRYRQVLSNLIDNAIKFTQEGYIIVSLAPLTSNGEPMTEIVVRDSGIGIHPEKSGVLFNAFRQLDTSITRNYGGSGLGLAISKKLTELMNGTITLDARTGKGSRFRVRLPANPESPSITGGLKEVTISPVKVSVSDRITRWMMRQFLKRLDIPIESSDAPVIIADGLNLKMEKKAGKRLIVLNRESEIDPGTETLAGVFGLEFLTNLFKSANPSKTMDKQKERKVQNRYSGDVLIAEDNPVNQLLMKRIFQKLEIPVRMAADGREVLAEVGKKIPDIIFMDMQMPVYDGLQATRDIRTLSLAKQPIIVALTANALDSDKEACLNAGMNDYLSKPVTINQVEDMLIKWGTV